MAGGKGRGQNKLIDHYLAIYLYYINNWKNKF